MLPESVIRRINTRHSVLLESLPCPKCGSLQAVMFFDMADGRPCARAVCLKCGREGDLPRYRVGEADAERLSQWSQIVRNGDDRRCHICGSDIQVEAHHIIPRSHDPTGRWWYAPTNGIALCRRCHELVHGEWMRKYDKEKRRE